jgi:hypothetical protein
MCTGTSALALVIRELIDLGMESDRAQAAANRARGMGVMAEEMIEDLIRACDGKGDAAQCSPVTTGGAALGMDGVCSSPMASIGACTTGDPSCGERRVCVPGMALMVSARCPAAPDLPECAAFRQLQTLGVNSEVADTLASTSPQNADAFVRLVRG